MIRDVNQIYTLTSLILICINYKDADLKSVLELKQKSDSGREERWETYDCMQGRSC